MIGGMEILADEPLGGRSLLDFGYETEAGSLLLEALARSNDQQLAGAIIFLLTASIVALNFFTDVLLAALDPRVRKSIVR